MDRFEIAAHLNTNLQKRAQDDEGWTEQIGDWALENFVSDDKKQEWIGQAVKESVPYLVSSLAGGAIGAGVSGEDNRLMGGASGAGIGALLTYIMDQQSPAEDKPIGGAAGAAGAAGEHMATHPAQGLAAGYAGTRGLGTVIGENSPASQLRGIKNDPDNFLKAKNSRNITDEFGEKASERFTNRIEEARGLQGEGKNLRAARLASKAERDLNPKWKKVFSGGGWRPEETAGDVATAVKETGRNVSEYSSDVVSNLRKAIQGIS